MEEKRKGGGEKREEERKKKKERQGKGKKGRREGESGEIKAKKIF